jgi:predicted nucleotidyltransferase
MAGGTPRGVARSTRRASSLRRASTPGRGVPPLSELAKLKSCSWLTGPPPDMMASMHREPTGHGAPHADRDCGVHGSRTDPSVPTIREFLRGRTNVRLALVFGSRARGTATPTSDVDVAVRAPGIDLLRLAADLSRATALEVDVVDLDDAGVPLLARIVREGVLAHEARPGAAARWRAQALADLETDAPWFARMREAWLKHVAARGV